MDGAHSIERCDEVTSNVLHAVFNALFDQKVSLEGMLLKPNMVISGIRCERQGTLKEVALSTVRCLSRNVPCAVPGVVFLSGGQNHIAATEHLSAINQLNAPKPWKLSFSYGLRAAGRSAQGLAGKERKSQGRPAGVLPPGQVRQRSRLGQVQRCHGKRNGRLKRRASRKEFFKKNRRTLWKIH